MRVVDKTMETRVTERRDRFVAEQNEKIHVATENGDTAEAERLTLWRDSYVRASSRVVAGARMSQG